MDLDRRKFCSHKLMIEVKNRSSTNTSKRWTRNSNEERGNK